MINFVVALGLILSSSGLAPDKPLPPKPPTVNLSAVRYIYCRDKGGDYTGSAFLIGNHELATANHIAEGAKCIDVDTGTEVKAFYKDSTHDFALMSAPGVEADMPYLKYRCDGIKAGQSYMSYGITDYEQDSAILRENTITATKQFNKEDDNVEGLDHAKGMRFFDGSIAPGMSGGPVVDISGYVVAVNNAGGDDDTMLYDIKDTILCKR